MISLKGTAAFVSLSLALLGCASSGVTAPQSASGSAVSYAEIDRSTTYAPSPNRVEEAPVNATAQSPGYRGVGCNEAPTSVGAGIMSSPNARLCP
ncbi:hypothetical protein LVJ94_41330 [Pendulispora rubella]|uniref:Lipoprotein n=1 Tax=Pendulispora rubella TaxID=2741070 RepID=A0ABZ2KXB7_9BACT